MLPVAVSVSDFQIGVVLHMQLPIHAVIMIRRSQYDLLYSQFAAKIAFHIPEEIALYLSVE